MSVSLPVMAVLSWLQLLLAGSPLGLLEGGYFSSCELLISLPGCLANICIVH
jgi:hypothetical protein